MEKEIKAYFITDIDGITNKGSFGLSLDELFDLIEVVEENAKTLSMADDKTITIITKFIISIVSAFPEKELQKSLLLRFYKKTLKKQ